MRDEVIAYITSNLPTGYRVTSKLPWSKNGDQLYLKNFKEVYVDDVQTEEETITRFMNGTHLVDEESLISIYVATDAKNLPSGYSELVDNIKNVTSAFQGYNQKRVEVSKEYVDDAVVTQFDVYLNLTKKRS